MAEQMFLSPEGYAAAGGSCCPACGGASLARGLLRRVEGMAVTEPVACLTCQARWRAVYELAGYEGVAEETSLC